MTSAIYLAMEWLQGHTLEDWIEKNGIASVPDILRLGREIATGLEVIHRNGLIHRDLKPSNLWIEQSNRRIKLLDFGLARPIEDDAKFTMSGNIVGTPAYMSPEQARGDRIDARSDLFSLGGVLYFLASGKLPFQADSVMGMLTALAVADPKPIRELNPRLPREAADLIMQLLAKKVERRPASAQEVVNRLEHYEKNLAAPALELNRGDSSTLVTVPVMVAKSGEESHSPRSIRKLVATIAISAFVFVCCLASGVMTPNAAPAMSRSLSRSRQWKRPSNPLTKVSRYRLKQSKFCCRPPRLPLPPTPQPPAAVKQIVRDIIPTPPAEMKLPEMKPVYLNDLEPYFTREWLRVPPEPPPPPKGGGPPPNPITGLQIKGKTLAHGLFMHPPLRAIGGSSAVTYRLEKKFKTFRGEVSLNDGPRSSDTPLQFSIYGDGQLLWKSHAVRSQADAHSFDVSINGVNELTIEVSCPGEPRGGHAVWVDPHVCK